VVSHCRAARRTRAWRPGRPLLGSDQDLSGEGLEASSEFEGVVLPRCYRVAARARTRLASKHSGPDSRRGTPRGSTRVPTGQSGSCWPSTLRTRRRHAAQRVVLGSLYLPGMTGGALMSYPAWRATSRCGHDPGEDRRRDRDFPLPATTPGRNLWHLPWQPSLEVTAACTAASCRPIIHAAEARGATCQGAAGGVLRASGC
jgi:hypothetical protein